MFAGERGVVAGEAEQHGLQLAISGLNLQHGDVRVHRTIRIQADNDALGRHLAAVDADHGLAVAGGELGRSQVAQAPRQ